MVNVRLIDLVLLLAVAGGGALVWRDHEKNAEAGRVAGAVGAEMGRAPVTPGGSLTGTLPAGTSGSSAPVSSADLWAAQQRQNEELLKSQRIDTLRRDLARINNQQDQLVLQANVIKAETPDPGFTQSLTDRAWAECRNGGAWITQAARCHNGNVPAIAQKLIQQEWGARIADRLRPLQAQLSQLQAEQRGTVENLMALGYQVPRAEAKQVTI